MAALDTTLRRMMKDDLIIGLALYQPGTRSLCHWNGDRAFPLASVAKLITAVAAAHRLAGMGLTEVTAPVADLIRRAVSHHDAAAADALLAVAGGEASVNAWLSELAIGRIQVAQENRRRDANQATPLAMLQFLRLFWEGRLTTGTDRSLVLDALRQQADPDGLLAGLPAGAVWQHMTGGLAGVCNDVGFLDGVDVPVFGALFLEGDANGDWGVLLRAAGEVGRLVGRLNR